jgi:eukaryotic translation initiation factor 2C
VVKKLSTAGASSLTFQMREGQTMTVADYFKNTQNKPLQFPEVICVCTSFFHLGIQVQSSLSSLSGGGWIWRPHSFGCVFPHLFGLAADLLLELCTVPPGQVSWRWLATMNTLTHILFKLMRKQVPPEKTKDVLDFATKKPHDRLQSIKNGLSVRFESYYTYRLLTFHQQVLAYGQSEYVRQFGMTVDHAAGPLKVQARVLKPPILKYGPGSRQLTIVRVSYSCSSVTYKFI